MNISDEFAEDIRRFAISNYAELLWQFYKLKDHHQGDGSHPDVAKAKNFLDRARKLRCEVDPAFAKEQAEQLGDAA